MEYLESVGILCGKAGHENENPYEPDSQGFFSSPMKAVEQEATNTVLLAGSEGTVAGT
jgi:hypothetical protein